MVGGEERKVRTGQTVSEMIWILKLVMLVVFRVCWVDGEGGEETKKRGEKRFGSFVKWLSFKGQGSSAYRSAADSTAVNLSAAAVGIHPFVICSLFSEGGGFI